MKTAPPPRAMNPITKATAIKMSGLEFRICQVSPETAADWLKRNGKNRKPKEATLVAYARDMKNNAWHLTHQGIAFDDKGNLIDGQHRLLAIVRSKKTVPLLVSAGWPANGVCKTMDAVDRGANRSLADQLKLQHDIVDANRVVIIANAIAAACLGGARVQKNTTAGVLAIVEIYSREIKFVMDNDVRTHGLKHASVTAVVAMARTVWPDKTSDFYTRLKTGENLAGNNPILKLRNWLMAEGANSDNQTIRVAVCHHLHAFVDGRPLNSLVCTSNTSLLHLLRSQKERVEKVCAIFGATPPPIGTTAPAPADETKKPFDSSPIGPDAIRVAGTLAAAFTTTDLSARLDSPNLPGLWLADWRRRGWIESAGPREFIKTASFGK